MPISERAIGNSWITTTVDQLAPLVGTGLQSGDRIFLFAAWKAFDTTAQITSPGTWTEITEFADGSVAAGANVGSVKVGCWYHDWLGDGSETDPTIDFSVNPAPAAISAIAFAKDAGETWDAPVFATAAIAAATTWSATASSSIAIAPGDLVIGIVGFRDDSATMTRPATTALGASGITWDANYHESPATHASTTTSNDISADSGYRIAASGSATVAPTMAGTLSASETGAALWIRQRVTASGGGGDDVAQYAGGGYYPMAKRRSGIFVPERWREKISVPRPRILVPA